MKNKFVASILALALFALALVGLNVTVSASPDGVNVLGPGEVVGGVYITPGSRARDLVSGNHKSFAIDQSQSLLVSSGNIESAWSTIHAPAANTQATISKAAGAAGVRHVCTGFSVSLSSGAGAPTPELITFAIRDGATGAGTILWQGTASLPATAGSHFESGQTELLLVGTAATAMTIETDSSPGANVVAVVSINGYSVK